MTYRRGDPETGCLLLVMGLVALAVILVAIVVLAWPYVEQLLAVLR